MPFSAAICTCLRDHLQNGDPFRDAHDEGTRALRRFLQRRIRRTVPGRRSRAVRAGLLRPPLSPCRTRGTPSTALPPLPGVTPATTLVPYSRMEAAWNEPSRPVIPWTMTRVFSPIRMLMPSPSPPLPPRPHRFGEVRGRLDAGRRRGLPALGLIRADQANRERNGDAQLLRSP